MRLSLVKAAVATCMAVLPGPGATDAGSLKSPHLAMGNASPVSGRPAPADSIYGSHSFYFTRAAYSGVRGGFAARTGAAWASMDPQGVWHASQGCGAGYCAWATDYPKAERQFLSVLRRLTNLDASPSEHAVRLDDPELRRYPFIYAVEVGYMDLTDAEVKGLREYLSAGGFLVADDFWGSREWRNFEEQMRRVFPEYPIVDVPEDHPIFSAVYDIDEIIQVPNIGNGRAGGATHERDGYVPHIRGIFDDEGRLLVVINWNSDFGDAWEWAEQPDYPLKYSTFAYQMGVNFIVYALSH